MQKTQRFPHVALLSTFLGMIFFSIPAFAHPDHGLTGFTAGLAHPWAGLDHLFTALAVGICAAGRDSRSSYAVLLSFLLAMICGIFLGQEGVIFPFREEGILMSMFFLGLCLLLDAKPGFWWGIPLLCGFGFFHGNAHGEEVTPGSFLLAPVLGLLLSTLTLHLLGIVSVKGLERLRAPRLVGLVQRCFGAFMVGSIFLPLS